MRRNDKSRIEDDKKLVDGTPSPSFTNCEIPLGSKGQPVPMADAPAALPDPSWGVAQLLDYGAAKWQDGLAKLKASVLDQWDFGNAVKLAHRLWGTKPGWQRELEAHGLAYSTARSRERIAEDCTREFASKYYSITDLQYDLGHIKERTKEYAPESPETDDWKAGWEKPPSTASLSSPKPTTAATTVTSPPSKPAKATGKSPSSKPSASPPSQKPTTATAKVASPPATDNSNETIPVAVEFAGEDQQTAWLNPIDEAIRDAKLTVELPFTRKQLHRILEIVKDDLGS
jgi:hypothetical protein